MILTLLKQHKHNHFQFKYKVMLFVHIMLSEYIYTFHQRILIHAAYLFVWSVVHEVTSKHIILRYGFTSTNIKVLK